MIFKIIWSAFAESQLDEIFDYYKNKSSISTAKKFLRGIINEPNKLVKSPLIGNEEELLKHKENNYRYLLHKNYKLILIPLYYT